MYPLSVVTVISLFVSNLFAGSSQNKCGTALPQKLDDSQRAELAIENEFYNHNDPTALNKPGEKAEVHTIYVMNNGQKLPIKAFRYPPKQTPSKGTVVFLCGGPSACLKSRPISIPNDFEIIGSDYIGLGQNALSPTPAELMSIDGQALATKKVIEAFKLKKYLIYGESFGTAVATATAHLIGQDSKATQPQSVVLEGTNSFPVIQDFVTPSNEAWKLLSQEEREKFMNRYHQLLSEKNAQDINALNFLLTFRIARGPSKMAQILKDISNSNKEQINRFINEGRSILNSRNYESQFTRMYSASFCQFYDPKYPSQTEGALYGNLIPNSFTNTHLVKWCDCTPISRKFEPKNYSIKVPLLYINGDSDPMTPLSGAKSHMASQIAAPSKALLIAKNDGHWPTLYSLSKCTSFIFDSAIEGDVEKFSIPYNYIEKCSSSTATNSIPSIQHQPSNM